MTPSLEELREALAYFESDEAKRIQDGDLDYINFEDRLQKLLSAARLYSLIAEDVMEIVEARAKTIPGEWGQSASMFVRPYKHQCANGQIIDTHETIGTCRGPKRRINTSFVVTAANAAQRIKEKLK